MNYSISNNAEYGEYVTGEAVVNDSSREAMRTALKNNDSPSPEYGSPPNRANRRTASRNDAVDCRE